MATLRLRATALLSRVAAIGTTNDDDDQTRAQKSTLTIVALVIVILSVAWVGAYWALGLPTAAAIPFAYQVASVASGSPRRHRSSRS